MKPFWIACLLVLIGDQASKQFLKDFLSSRGVIEIIPGFLNLVSVWNPGVAFGVFSQAGAFLRFILGSVSLVAAVALFFYARKQDGLGKVLSGLIAGGALGNLIDRLLYGQVFDFLDFHLGPYHWPAFNLADAAITVGVCGLLIRGLLKA